MAQAGSLQLPGLAVATQGMLPDQMQACGDEVKDLLVPKPTGRLAVHFQSCGLEEQDMAAVLQGSHVGVERLPVVADQRQAAVGSELWRHVAQFQEGSQRMPAQGLHRLGLAQSLQ